MYVFFSSMLPHVGCPWTSQAMGIAMGSPTDMRDEEPLIRRGT